MLIFPYVGHQEEPLIGLEPLRESHLETLNSFTSCTGMETAMKEVHSALTRAANEMAQFYDAHSREAQRYMVRDKVWLNRQNIMTTHLMKKIDHKWLGPYSV